MFLLMELLLQCVLQLRNWVLCLIAISPLTIIFPMFVEQPFSTLDKCCLSLMLKTYIMCVKELKNIVPYFGGCPTGPISQLRLVKNAEAIIVLLLGS